MQLVIHEAVVFDSSPEAVWALCVDVAQMLSFGGYGPIPGIASVRYLRGTEPTTGAVREITNTDGSTHCEEVVDLVPLRRIEDRVFAMSSPFRFLVSEGQDVWEFDAVEGGTRLRRSFGFTLRSPLLWPVAMIAMALMRRAIRRHHTMIGDLLRGS